MPASSSGAPASSSTWSGKPSASSSSNTAPLQPPHVAAAGIAQSVGSSSYSGSARTRRPRRTLQRSYTMYPADGSTGELPLPRMGPALLPWVSSLTPEQFLLEPAAAASSSEVPQKPDAELVVPIDVAQGDDNIAQQLASMHLAPRSASTKSPQRRSQPPPAPERPRATPRATRLPAPGRPRTRATSGRGSSQSGAQP